MTNVTGDQVKAAMKAANITVVDHHDCSLCGYMTNYNRDGDALFFDPGCMCREAPDERRSWQEAADWINMQTNEAVRRRLLSAFGFRDELRAMPSRAEPTARQE